MADLLHNHGSARRVPPAGDEAWRSLAVWLGSSAAAELAPASGELTVVTEAGRQTARAGDWLVKTMAGGFHIGRAGQ
jgi:hypothetical protein